MLPRERPPRCDPFRLSAEGLAPLACLLAALGCAQGGAGAGDAQGLADGGAPAPDAGGACGAAECGSAQRCDRSVSPPACIEICNPPAGCRPGWETCELQSGACSALACGAGPCQLGQGCFDPATLAPSAGAGSVCTCLPKAFGAEARGDSCAPYGTVCGYDPASKAAAACRRPREFEGCRPAVGCGDGLGCASTPSGGLCLRSCAKAEDCPKPTEYCDVMDGHCWTNECARPDRSASERERYFKPCDAAGAADGTCLPVAGPSGEVGLCFQGGSAPSHGACDPAADRANPSGICPVGELCQTASGADGGAGLGVCRTACDPAPSATSGCAAGERCLDISGAASLYQGAAGRLGACLRPASG